MLKTLNVIQQNQSLFIEETLLMKFALVFKFVKVEYA